jgi:hypothetical protein
MTQPLNQSDSSLIRSGCHEQRFFRGSTQTPPAAGARPTTARADHTWVTNRDLQALRSIELSLQQGHGPKRYLSTVARTGDRARLGYVPNATYPQVADFLANYRKLQEMLNEICALNAELLRRRESLD